MDTTPHNLQSLFAQLGLRGDRHAINAFLAGHRLAGGTLLPDAPFWNAGQSQFLREALAQDSDWAEMADELAMLLSQPR
jgi:Protein of unknown function (DUF2789)